MKEQHQTELLYCRGTALTNQPLESNIQHDCVRSPVLYYV